MKYAFKLVSSLEKNFLAHPDTFPETVSGSMMKNEIHAFQLVCWAENVEWPQKSYCRVELDSPIARFVRLYEVGYVPSLLPAYSDCACEDYITKKPGLFPDPLYPVKDSTILLYCGQSRSIWVAVEPDGSCAGSYPITLRLYDEENQLVGQQTYQLEIIDAVLPELPIYNTGWFHGDCIALHHGLQMQSEEYFALLEQYLLIYKKFGHNTVLTPVFTPPLDTKIGGERPTNQLVQVTVEGGKYRFDFSLLKRWIDLCRKVGIRNFEISHLYSQWGAKYAPKVMATVDGEYKRIFGWETDALGEDYAAFLGAFLPELTAFLKEQGILERCLFHVSDEPTPEQVEQYRAAKELLLQYISEDQMIDALHAYELHESGAVKHPVVSIDHIHTFMEHDVQGLWAYYCCGQGVKVANRFMAMPSYRNRVLGSQLYKADVKGFLQWGFNFWLSQHAVRAIDPYTNTSADGGFPSGDSYLVYPMKDGQIICSLRLYVFCDAMQDLRALKLLESLSSREEVEALLTELDGFMEYPRNSGFYLALRETVNKRIQALL